MKVDYLIIGQGLAGTLLAHFLRQGGQKVVVVDDGNPCAASKVTLGLMNPIMGRKMKKAWKVETIYPFAKKTYQTIGDHFGEPLYFSKNILRIFLDEKQKKIWSEKENLPEYKPYIAVPQQGQIYEPWLDLSPGWVEITQSGHVLVNRLLSLYRSHLAENQALVQEQFTPAQLQLRQDRVVWQGIEARKIIFCEGHKARENPFFAGLHFAATKGETLTIKVQALPEERIIHKGIFLLPLGQGLFKVGATHNWNDLTETFTDAGKNELVAKLESLLKVPFEIVAYQVGVRPTLITRKPVLGLHPEHPQVGIFNGLGSKGVSRAPFFAWQFAAFLQNQTPLDPEVDLEQLGWLKPS